MTHPRRLSSLPVQCLICLAAVGPLLAACDSSDKGDAKASDTAPRSAGVTSASAPVASASAALVEAPASAAPAAPSAAPDEFPASGPMPPLERFGAARELSMPGSTKLNCEPKVVGQWFRIICGTKAAEVGLPQRLELERGRVPGKTVVTVRMNEIAQVITPLVPGEPLEGVVAWGYGKEHSFRVELPADGGPPVAAFEGFAEAPPSDFDGAPEVTVPGSSQLGCETQLSGTWLRVRCGTGSEVAGAPQAIARGDGLSDANSMVAVTTGSVAQLLVKLEPGIEGEATFEWSNTSKKLLIDWPATAGDTPPRLVARFEGYRVVPSGADWKTAEEVNVTGSTALKCSTRFVLDWMQVVCVSANADHVELVSGLGAEDTTLHRADGLMSATFPCEAGTDAVLRFHWTDQVQELRIQWPAGAPRPKKLGAFSAPSP